MSELTRRDFQCLLDEVAKAIGKYPSGFTYTDLPGQVKAECERLTKIIDDNNAVTKQWVDEAKSTLPEPDATNPNHLRWAADVTERFVWAENSGGYTAITVVSEMKSEADRLDAARTVEREREQRIEAARAAFKATSGIDTSPADGWIEAIVDALADGGGVR